MYYYIYNNYRLVDLPWHSPLMWYFAAMFVDFCYYWGHRGTHGKLHEKIASIKCRN